MKKIVLAVLVVMAGLGSCAVAHAQYANCWQQYVCGGGGCQWITICR